MGRLYILSSKAMRLITGSNSYVVSCITQSKQENHQQLFQFMSIFQKKIMKASYKNRFGINFL